MTRFARAKGSKACNEKAPEDGTPWEVMREQLLQAKKENEDAKKRKEAENQRIENYEKFLQERKVQKRNATWCDFPETEEYKKNESIVESGIPNKKKKKLKQQVSENGPAVSDVGPTNENNIKKDATLDGEKKIKKKDKKKKKIKKKDKKKKKIKEQVSENGPSVADVGQTTENSIKSDVSFDEEKKKKKKVSKVFEVETSSNKPTQNVTEPSKLSEDQQSKKKKKKNKQNNQSTVEHTLLAKEDSNVPENYPKDQINVPLENKNKKKKKKNKSKSSPTENENSNNKSEVTENRNENNLITNTNKQNKIKALIKKKDKGLIDGKPVRRKEVTERSFQLIINGKEVELVRFDGFPVMKKDAERLGELRQSMLQKGIPKSEVQRTLKLERRRAEKALARMKRDVCYNCRKGGHNLSDCPELKSKIPGTDAADGVCFKCGSTEHRQFECKVQRDKEFRFATCFICKEPGHIARQCPDNPKGLYPNGGCCKLCGDVTHLRKDCPTVNEKKEERSVKLQTLDVTENIEDIGQQMQTAFTEEVKKPKKIKFF